MRIQLVHPSLDKASWYTGCEGPKIASLTLPTVAAATPKDVDVFINDERVEDIDYNSGADLVGITFMSRLAKKGYEIAAEFKKRGTTVVFGGIHSTAMPEEALQYADAVVLGEAEGAWPQLIEDFQKGQLQPLYQSKEPPSLQGLPFARRDLLKSKKYISTNVMQATRGCPYACSFCFTHKFFRKSYRMRPIREVMAEIGTLPGKDVLFLDDNIIGSREYALEFFTALRKKKKWWFSQCDITLAKDEELLRAASRSGCKVLLVGFETLSNKNLRNSKKGWSRADEYAKLIKRLHENGIGIIASFIVGFDDDNEMVFEEILDFLLENKVEFMQCNPLALFPGTDVVEKNAIANDSRLDRWWLSGFPHHYKAFHKPKSMSIDDLENGCAWLYKSFYSYENITKRLLRTPFPMLVYTTLVNMGFRNICRTVPMEAYNPADRLRERYGGVDLHQSSAGGADMLRLKNAKSSKISTEHPMVNQTRYHDPTEIGLTRALSDDHVHKSGPR
jgi:radical SAM superfamily enzyme YgiQ (UPF0313 family)